MKDISVLVVRNDTDKDSDAELPSIRRLLSPEYRYKLAKEGSIL